MFLLDDILCVGLSLHSLPASLQVRYTVICLYCGRFVNGGSCTHWSVCAFQDCPWTSRRFLRCLGSGSRRGRRRVCRASSGPVTPLCPTCRSWTRCVVVHDFMSVRGVTQRWKVCVFTVGRLSVYIRFPSLRLWVWFRNLYLILFWSFLIISLRCILCHFKIY